MSPPVISVENIGKRYVIGHQRSNSDGIRHVVEDAMRAPLKWLRQRADEQVAAARGILGTQRHLV